MAEPGRAQRRRRGAAPMRLVLTRRALADPLHGQCGVCLEPLHIKQVGSSARHARCGPRGEGPLRGRRDELGKDRQALDDGGVRVLLKRTGAFGFQRGDLSRCQQEPWD